MSLGQVISCSLPIWRGGRSLTHQSLFSFFVTTILSPSLNPSSSLWSGSQSYWASAIDTGCCVCACVCVAMCHYYTSLHEYCFPSLVPSLQYSKKLGEAWEQGYCFAQCWSNSVFDGHSTHTYLKTLTCVSYCKCADSNCSGNMDILFLIRFGGTGRPAVELREGEKDLKVWPLVKPVIDSSLIPRPHEGEKDVFCFSMQRGEEAR